MSDVSVKEFSDLYVPLRQGTFKSSFVYLDDTDNAGKRFFKENNISVKECHTLCLKQGMDDNLRLHIVKVPSKKRDVFISCMNELKRVSLIKGWGAGGDCKQVMEDLNGLIGGY